MVRIRCRVPSFQPGSSRLDFLIRLFPQCRSSLPFSHSLTNRLLSFAKKAATDKAPEEKAKVIFFFFFFEG